MVLKSIKNNLFLYLLSLSNCINYIFYFPLILFYLAEEDNLQYLDSIKIFTFFIIYDLIRNIFLSCIRKITYYFGINKIISINLIILALINIALYFLFKKIENKSFLLNIIIILRIVFSLTNVSSIFISKIAENIFMNKERYNKLTIFDFYEKLNNFLIFVFIFFFINTFEKLYIYFFCSGAFNLCFYILYTIMFRCHDEKKYLLNEEQDQEIKINQNKLKNQNYNKGIKNKKQNMKGVYTLAEENYLSKSNNKDIFNSKYRKNSSGIIVNDNLAKSKFNGSENRNISDNYNNDIILSTNNNQIVTNNNNENIRYQNKELDNPMVSSNRGLKESQSKRNSFIAEKNEKILNKKKWIFIFLILVPFKFLKYLFLLLLFFKTYSLRNNFEIKIHLIFYCCYFLMNILIYPLNKKLISKMIRGKKGKKIISLISIIFLIPSCIGYSYINLDDTKNDTKRQLEKYIMFFILNFILKEGLYILLRIYYINSILIGFNKTMFNHMKEMSNVLTCFSFLLYNILLLFVQENSKSAKIIKYLFYYILPVLFLFFFFINTFIIS